MATHRVSLFHRLHSIISEVYPQPSGNVFTNDIHAAARVLTFTDTATKIGMSGSITVPKNYVGTLKFYVIWTSTVTSGNVVWDVDYSSTGGDNTTSLDVAAVEEALTVTDAAPGASLRRLNVEVSATSANVSADDTLQVTLSRDGADGSDTLAGSAHVVDFGILYADA